MSEFFAKISNQFTGPLLMAAFFPVLLFVTIFALVVLPITGHGKDFTAAVQNPDVWKQNPVAALVVVIAVLMLSVILYNMNTQIVRLYEGYPWKQAWIAQPFLWLRRRDYQKATRIRQQIRTLRRQMRLGRIGANVAGAITAQSELGLLLNNYYPDDVKLVLPTRLGNAIRAFETYTRRQYGAPAIALWPRLQAVIDGNLATAVDSVKTSFDFMIHSAFLSAVLSLLTATSGLFWQVHSNADILKAWLWWALAFAVISWLLYEASITRAIEWGTQVKTAFDLYRFALLSKLGYDVKPVDLADERRIWENLHYRFALPDENVYPDLPYKGAASCLVANPPTTVLKSSRAMTPLEDGSIQIELLVSNIDPTAWDADNVIVREEIPTGKTYVRGTAMINGAPAKLLSIDPLQIDLGALPYCDSRTVVYRIAKGT